MVNLAGSQKPGRNADFGLILALLRDIELILNTIMVLNQKPIQTVSILTFVLLLGVTACRSIFSIEDSAKLKVVATTSFLADVVGMIGAEMIDLSVLLPPGSDAHTFQPTPQDMALLTGADVIIING